MTFIQTAFANEQSRTYHIVNDSLAVLTVVSIVAVVLETVPALASYHATLAMIEWVAVAIFTLEYLGRTIAAAPHWWRYPTSFFGYIDLMAILPTFLGLGNFTFLKSARTLRIMRLLRMVRLAKVARSGAHADDLGVLSFNVVIYLTTLTTALLATGTLMYLVEPDLAAFASIPAGMWWSLQVFLGSLPVVEPVTGLGQVLYVVTRFVGLLLLGLLIGVVGNVFRTLVLGER